MRCVAASSQATESILGRIAQTTDLRQLEALCEVLHALELKLADPQAQDLLTSILKQIGQADDRFALDPLGQAFQSLARSIKC